MSRRNFFVTGGALQADAGSYVPRQADHELLEGLRTREFCYVLTSRQMGKSSLMVRAAVQLRQEGCAVVILDLTAVGQNLDVDQWYFSLLSHVGEKLELEEEMEAYWDANQRRGPMHRFLGAIREVYLEKKRKPLIIFVDEIDAVRSLVQFSADEFFAGIRETYNRRADDEKLKQLTFCLLGVATPSDLIRDQRITPFNIGRAIELKDFTAEEAAILANGLSPHVETAHVLLERILWWTNGQPYLTQKLCAEVAKGEARSAKDVDSICERAFLSPEARERDDNLHFVRDRILRSEQERAALLDTYAKVFRGEPVEDDHLNPVVNELRLSGIVRVDHGLLKTRNSIYSKIFDRKWIRQNLPDAERERQRAAYYRGIRRVAGVAALVLAVMGGLAFNAWRNAKAAQLATEKQQKADADLLREAGRTKSALNRLVDTQSRVEALLEVLTPLVGEKSGNAILDRAERVVQSASNEASDDPRVVLGVAGLRRVCGRLYLRLGNETTALKQAEEAQRLIQTQLQAGNTSSGINRQLRDSLILQGDAILGGRTPEAIKRKSEKDYARAMALYQHAAYVSGSEINHHPDAWTWRQLYFNDLNYLGDTAQLFGPPKAKEAESYYEAALERLRDVRKKEPPSQRFDRIEAAIHDRLGALYLSLGRKGEARTQFDTGLKLTQVEANDDSADDPERQAELALSLNKLGNLFKGDGKLKEALDYYERSLSIRQKLSEENKSRDSQRNLGFSLHNVAQTLWRLGWGKDPAMTRRAIELTQERLQLAETLHEEDPSDEDLKTDYANALYGSADALLNVTDNTLKDWPRALELAQHAVILTERRNPRHLALLSQALRFAKRLPDALRTAEEAEKILPPPEKRTDDEKDLAEGITYELKKIHLAMANSVAKRH